MSDFILEILRNLVESGIPLTFDDIKKWKGDRCLFFEKDVRCNEQGQPFCKKHIQDITQPTFEVPKTPPDGQCSAIKKTDGERCTRAAKEGGMCAQHFRMSQSVDETKSFKCLKCSKMLRYADEIHICAEKKCKVCGQSFVGRHKCVIKTCNMCGLKFNPILAPHKCNFEKCKNCHLNIDSSASHFCICTKCFKMGDFKMGHVCIPDKCSKCYTEYMGYHHCNGVDIALRSFGLKRGCTRSDIKKVFREMAIEKHPDKGGNAEEYKILYDQYKLLLENIR